MNKYINVKVTGNEENLAQFISLCKRIEDLGRVGSTDTIKVWVDGDGAARLDFDFKDTDVTQVSPAPYSDSSSAYVVDME